MSPAPPGEETPSPQGDADGHSLGDRIRALLPGERQRLREEIRAYPTPVPPCDRQFNALIDRREPVCAKLARLEDAVAAAAGGDVQAPAALLDSSRRLDDQGRPRLNTALLKKAPDRRRRAVATESDRAPTLARGLEPAKPRSQHAACN